MTVTPLTRSDKLVALGLALAVFVITLAASTRQGLHRDEAYYMDAGEQYATWWERTLTGELEAPLSKTSIMAYWGYNYEHPPLMKVLYGLSWRLLHRCDCAADKALHPRIARLDGGAHRTLGLTSEITAFRIPTMICFALLAAVIFLWSIEATGSRLGAAAAAAFVVLQPRIFFHAQTASFDLPAAFFWVATAWAYWRALAGGVRRAIWTGLLFGLFLATKLQSFFLPFALGAHWIGVGLLSRRRGGRWPTVLPFVSMAVLGPLVLFALWPLLWHAPFDQLGKYLSFHLKHVHYNFEYLGQNWNRPPYPWHEPLGMLWYTAPVTLLACALGGAIVLARDGLAGVRARAAPPADRRATGLLWLCAGLVPIAIFFPGSAPIFGETKHWLATTAFLALAAGVAVGRLVPVLARELQRLPRLRRVAPALVLASALLPPAVEVARSHPYGLSHYNALAGGAPGGADLGMNRQFWGYATRGLFPTLNTVLPPRAKLYPHDLNADALELVLRDGQLRRDIVDAGMEEPGIRASDAALVVHERHFAKYDYMIWSAYGTVAPTQVLTLDGVPLVSLYRRAAR